MCAVFGSFVLPTNAIVKMFGRSATAVFVDATIVRCLLVPAIMVLAQKGTWWLPRLVPGGCPHVAVEGDPRAFDAVPSSGRTRHLARRGPAFLAALWAVVASWLPVCSPPGRLLKWAAPAGGRALRSGRRTHQRDAGTSGGRRGLGSRAVRFHLRLRASWPSPRASSHVR